MTFLHMSRGDNRWKEDSRVLNERQQPAILNVSSLLTKTAARIPACHVPYQVRDKIEVTPCWMLASLKPYGMGNLQ